ncbi:MAG: WecB/TagA/CpsF family glycosyltransferase [Bilifractor sp.]
MCAYFQEPGQKERIRVGDFELDCLNVDQVMERLQEFIQNDHLNTFAFLSRKMLIEANEDAILKDYVRRLDVGVICEHEVLEAAGITGGRVFEDVVTNNYYERLFWQIVKAELGVYLLCEEGQQCTRLKKFLEETYPGIRIVGMSCELAGGGVDSDHVLNQINSAFPDIVITGLSGNRQNHFMIQNQAKVFGKIWMNLGESPWFQSGSGVRTGWLASRRIKRYFRQIFVQND